MAITLFVLTGCANGLTPILPACASTQLTVENGRNGVAMGHVGITGAGFKNVSTTTCTLKSYPDLQMLDAVGHPIQTHVIDGTSYTVQSMPEDVVTLAPGAEAMFDLGYDNSTGYGTASCPTSAQVEITPPNTNEPIRVPWQLQPYGGGSIPQLQCGEITVSPVYTAP